MICSVFTESDEDLLDDDDLAGNAKITSKSFTFVVVWLGVLLDSITNGSFIFYNYSMFLFVICVYAEINLLTAQ